MAVSNVNQMGGRWSSGVNGKKAKFQEGFQRSRGDVITGLRRIGANPGPNFTAAVNGADAGRAAEAWASKVQGKESKYTANWLAAISR